MDYLEKLKDPRWQKKRLKIFERDEWCCVICGDNLETLNVHHLKYKQGAEPWEYEDRLLITTCESCHKSEKDTRKGYEKTLIDLLKEKIVRSDDMFVLIEMFYDMPFLGVSHQEFILQVMAWWLKDEKIRGYVIEKYFVDLAKKRKKRNSKKST